MARPLLCKRISNAIKAAAHLPSSKIDYTEFVNVFIGTDNDGDVCPGASVPFGMVKFSTDMTGYAPAGYITDNTQTIRGISPLHDSGTGSSLGTYGNFEVMPMTCPGGFDTCLTSLTARETFRKNNTDDASPGYFALTLENGIKMEATSTRRAGLERFTFPKKSKPYFVLDLANDLPGSFAGGSMNIDPQKGRITLGGLWSSSFGPTTFEHQIFACYDITNGGNQTLDEYGQWIGCKGLGQTQLNFTRNLIGGCINPALSSHSKHPSGDPPSCGISFRSTDQACSNAETEQDEVDVANTPANVTEMLYSSLYRSFLTPNNATEETQGPFADTTHQYFDSLYCSWDTFRTFYPLMSLTSPCRANHMRGWTQGGSSADPIVGHFAVTYHDEAEALGIDLDDLYSAMLADGNNTPPNWDIEGRQADVYIKYGYVPASVLVTNSVGRQTREGSRTLEASCYLLNVNYRNVFDKTVKSDGFQAFPQGSFVFTNPINCSPQDNVSRSCSLQDANTGGFYESSSWEYSWFAPHDTAHLVELMGGNETFVKRLDHFFDAGYYLAGNEPSFQTPIGYHYADHPTLSVDRVRDVVFSNFDITPAGIPGNDDQAAMATLLSWHLLGFYPVPSSTQLLVLSPFIPKYTIHNSFLNVSTTVTTKGFDPRSVQHTIPKNVAAYVANVTINGVPAASRCHIDFYDIFKTGGDIVIEVTADKASVDDCGGSLPESISTGGFSTVR
ncbi:glycoside hydrolase family 92 protein [Irpex lacteus]|nr:glycoside hydrolase family 92 protein [Irpex lacteus]